MSEETFTVYNKNVKHVSTLTSESKPIPRRPKNQFYKRELPTQCTAFSSEKGKLLFKEALMEGYAEIYFPLAEQFCTQAEPAYCGLTTLVMVLNTLAVDPGRIWRGGWRWYHEEMLDCCLSLDVVQQQGITMEQFVCLATCNNLDLNVVRMSENESIEEFRNVVKTVCNGTSLSSRNVLVCSYSRKQFGQTGDGHFSPIGAYHPGEDKVLIFDVARFKYPPHWVKLELLWDAMKLCDATTEKPRGYIVMRKTEAMSLILFRLSPTFRVTIATHNLMNSCMARFLKTWKQFLKDSSSACTFLCNESFENTLKCLLEALNEALSSLMEGESVFTTQFAICCTASLPEGHMEEVMKLIQSIEQTEIFNTTKKLVVERHTAPAVQPKARCEGNFVGCAKNSCCISRVGKPMKNPTDIEETIQEMKCITSNGIQGKKSCRSNCKRKKARLITESHYITMLLLCWPYHVEGDSVHILVLSEYVRLALQQCDKLLQNEASMLRKQIESLISMVERQEKL